MPRQYQCSFCGRDIPFGKGSTYVKIDGSIFRFCSKKCKTSQIVLKRKPRRLKWTKRYERRIV
jgi:large subunit ribosomal protein L24e